MSDENKHNLLYFDSDSMRGLYEILVEWNRLIESVFSQLTSSKIKEDSAALL